MAEGTESGNSWPQVSGYKNGDAITAEVMNGPIYELASRTAYLRGRIEALSLTEKHAVTVVMPYVAGVALGDVVYRDGGVCRKALAQTSSADMFIADEGAFAIGIVTQVDGGNATVTVFGETGDVAKSVHSLVETGETFRPGRYYVSCSEPGKMTATPKGPAMLVGFVEQAGDTSFRCHVNAQYNDTSISHVHRVYEIAMSPSSEGSEGWIACTSADLPGYSYKYNMPLGTKLYAHYPPVPAECASLLVDGVEQPSVNTFGDRGVYYIGQDTLYWRDGTPWGSSTGPYPLGAFVFAKGVLGDSGPVTSLVPAKGSPIVIRGCDTGDTSAVGDLEIDLDIDFKHDATDEPGFIVAKQILGNNVKTGPVVERIKPGPGIDVVSSPGFDGQGVVEIGVSGSYSGVCEEVGLRNAKKAMVGLFPYYKLLGWNRTSSSNIDTAFTVKFKVPHDADPDASYRAYIHATIFGESGFAGNANAKYAGIGVRYSVLPDYTAPGDWMHRNLKTGTVNSPGKVYNVPFGTPDSETGTFSYSGFDPFVLENGSGQTEGGRRFVYSRLGIPDNSDLGPNAVPSGMDVLRPGYIVAVEFYRAAASASLDEYRDPVGFIDVRWTLERA